MIKHIIVESMNRINSFHVKMYIIIIIYLYDKTLFYFHGYYISNNIAIGISFMRKYDNL